MAKRGAARRAVVADEGTGNPDRPDNIPSQDGDDAGGVVDATGKDDVIDINAVARDEDARPDAEKEQERRDVEEERLRLERANEEAPDPKARRGADNDDDDEERGARRRTRRRSNRERELDRASDERVTNVTAENRRLKEQLAKVQRGGNQKELELSIGQMKAQIDALKKDLFTHTEGGKTAEALDVQIKIGEIQARLALAERDLEAAKRQPDPVVTEDADEGGKPEKKRPQIVNDWLSANRRWWNLPSAAPLRAAATAIDESILDDIKEGVLDFEPYSEDHVDEMTERLLKEAQRLDLDFEINDFNGERFELEEDDPAKERDEPAAKGRERGRDVRTNANRRPPAGGLGGREGGRKPPSDLELARQGKARLTEDDYKQMRVYKLDPNDPEARKRFAKERVRTILTEARKTGDRK